MVCSCLVRIANGWWLGGGMGFLYMECVYSCTYGLRELGGGIRYKILYISTYTRVHSKCTDVIHTCIDGVKRSFSLLDTSLPYSLTTDVHMTSLDSCWVYLPFSTSTFLFICIGGFSAEHVCIPRVRVTVSLDLHPTE